MDYQNFATLGVNLNRQKYGPLDISSVFTSQEDLDYYVSMGTASISGVSNYWKNITPYPYEGQIVSLNKNGIITIFKLKAKGSIFEAEDITAAVQKDLNQFRNETAGNIIGLNSRVIDVENAIKNLPGSPDLTSYATRDYVDETVGDAVTSAEENMKSELYAEVELLNAAIGGLQTDLSSFVPKSRTINGYQLSANIKLDAEDVKADPEGTAETKASAALTSAKAYTEEYALPKTTKINGQSCNSSNNYVIEASNISLTNPDESNAAKLNVETYLNYLDSEIKNVAIGSEFLPRDTVINNVKFVPGYSNSEGTFPPSYTLDATHIPVFDRGFSVSDYLSASLDNLRLNDTDGNGLAIVYSKNNSDEETFLRPFDNYPLKKAANALGAVRMETAKAEGLRDPSDLDSELYQMPKGAMAIGNETIASGIASFSTGINSEANGSGAFAGNYGTTATGDYSTALGRDTTASAMAAFTTGDTNTASGFASFVAGSNNEASGYVSSVLGYNNKATAYYSHAEGCGTIAASIAQHVQGQFNIEDSAEKYAHIVGWGNAYARANIHTLETNGNAWFAGTGKFEGEVYSGNEKLATSKQVATLQTSLSSVIESHKTLIDSKADASTLANYVPTSRTINNKALTNNISLSYSDVGADAAGTALGYYNTLNNKIENIDLSGYVPTSRTINSKALTNNISLTYSDVGADKSGSAATAESNAKSYANSTFLKNTITVNQKSIDGNGFNINAYDIRTLPDDQPDSAIADNKASVGLYLSTLDNEIDNLKAKTENSAYITQDQLFINGMAWGGVGSGGKADSFTLTGQNIKATIQKAPASPSEETFPIEKTLTNLISGSFRKVLLNETSRRFVFESWDGSQQSVEIPGASLSNLLNGELHEGAVKMVTACEEGQTPDGQLDENYILGPASMVIGQGTRAGGEASFAIGVNTSAGTTKRVNSIVTPVGSGIFAAGIGTSATRDASAAFGTYNNPGSYLFTVGNGYVANGATSPTKQNAFTLDSTGNAWFAGRIQIGMNTSQDQGGNTGWDSNDATGANTLITRFEMEQYVNDTVGKEVVNLAHISDGTEDGSFYTSTSSYYKNNLGLGSVTLGQNTKASGEYAFAIGVNTVANNQAFAQGFYTEAGGTNSAAFGYWTSAKGTDSLVCGRANVIDNSSIYGFTVGIGDNAANRANGFTVDWDGNGWFAGEIRVGGTSTSSYNTVLPAKLVSTQTTPTTNNVINWLYE